MGDRARDRAQANPGTQQGMPGGPAQTPDYSRVDMITTWDGKKKPYYYKGLAGDPPGASSMPGVQSAVQNGPVRADGLGSAGGPTPPQMSDFAYGGRSQSQWDLVADEYKKRAAIAPDFSLSDASRGMMGDAAARYLALANGEGPSLAQAQLQAGTDKSIAAQMAMANSQRGGALQQASALRGAQLGGQQMLADHANRAAQLRAQEQLSALAGYGGMAGQMRGLDLSQAGMGADVALRSRAGNDAMVQGAYGHGMSAAQLEQVGRMGYAGLKGSMAIQKYIGDQNARVGVQTNAATNATTQRGQDMHIVETAIGTAVVVGGVIVGYLTLNGSNKKGGNTTDPSGNHSMGGGGAADAGNLADDGSSYYDAPGSNFNGQGQF